MIRLAVLCIAGVVLGTASGARADLVADCVQTANNELAIEACSEIIRANQSQDTDLAIAHSNRGIARRRKGDLAGALEDYNEAIRRHPTFAKAFQNRGVVYEALGDFDAAIADTERAIEIDGTPRVRWWQTYLRDNGHYNGQIDGVFGRSTRSGLAECIRDPDC